MAQRRGENLGRMLQAIAGVSVLQTGATIAKPIVQGMYGNRVLIINNESRLESQQWGSDHAPEIDPFIAQKITLTKGAESVKYGADAIGGVIIVNPANLPYGERLHGALDMLAASNAAKGVLAARMDGSFTRAPSLAFRLQGYIKAAGDMRTARYLLNNTGVREHNFSAALGYQKKALQIETYFSQFQTELGVFYGAHIGNPEDLKVRFDIGRPLQILPFSYRIDNPRQVVTHRLAKAKGVWKNALGGTLSAIYAYQQNHRREYSPRRGAGADLPSLDLVLSTHSIDVDYVRTYFKKWKTQVGYHFMFQQNASVPGNGVVPVIPNFASAAQAAFLIQQFQHKNLQLEAGLRYDHKLIFFNGINRLSRAYTGERTFSNLTYNVGVLYDFTRVLSIRSNVAYAWRAPQAIELYAEGLHHGAGIYLQGDPHLSSERSVKWITTLAHTSPKLHIEVSAYVQHFHNYIYDQPTQQIRTLFAGAFPVFAYRQAPARFGGFDAQAQYTFIPQLQYGIKTAVVRAVNTETKGYFPFIPADRVSHNIQWNILGFRRVRPLYVQLEHAFVAQQKRFDPKTDLVPVAPPAYHLLHLRTGAHFPLNKMSVRTIFSINNLTNTYYKDYTNRFRYYAHDMGINVELRVALIF